jgi:hypothetical protein
MTHISQLEQPQEELFHYPLHLRYQGMTSTRRITVLVYVGNAWNCVQSIVYDPG